MSTQDDKPGTISNATDEELRRLIANLADAIQRGVATPTQGRGAADKFWDRLSSVSTFVGSVVLGAVALMFNSNYNNQQAAERQAAFNFEQQKFIADERDRQRKIVIDLSPKILSEKQEERVGGQALLSHFFPGDAPHILGDLAKGSIEGAPQEVAKQFDQEIKKANERAREAGTWGIVVGHDDSLESARDELKREESLGFTGAIYKKGGRNGFITVALAHVGESAFNDESDAQAANYTIRGQIRDSAYTVSLKNWCQNPQQQDGFIQCSNQ
jgi:acyl-CoA synthetase (AMP-forming)/AMP-acid ligase II